jgi:hypothetical protein
MISLARAIASDGADLTIVNGKLNERPLFTHNYEQRRNLVTTGKKLVY